MSKVRIVVALSVVVMLGGLAVKFAGKSARADSRTNKANAVVVRAEAALAAANALPAAGAPEVAAPGILNPFPALNAAMAGGATTVQNSNQQGFVDLNPINRSGIQALIHVERIGQTETITGFATGMDPYKAYVSLFYDAGSPGTGPCACIPSNPPPAALQATCPTTNAPPVNFSQMVIGYWLPLIGSSKRTMQVLKAGATNAPVPLAFVPLENIGSVSVREDTQLGQPLPAAPDPARFQLRACGKFRIDR
jgi:hypothetical protein